jgi:hypothetical protein
MTVPSPSFRFCCLQESPPVPVVANLRMDPQELDFTTAAPCIARNPSDDLVVVIPHKYCQGFIVPVVRHVHVELINSVLKELKIILRRRRFDMKFVQLKGHG